MADKIPELRIGKVDGRWVIAVRERFSWTEAGTGNPLDFIAGVGEWTLLTPEVADV